MGFEMTERKRAILNAIIKEYIMSAEPVGSRALARRYELGVSPATIRNEMADLEEQGYLEQPHVSAGRIPSDKGYRYYVDSLMDMIPPPEMVEKVKKAFSLKQSSIQEIVQNTSKMLSKVTRYTTLVLSPAIKKSKFKYIQLLPLEGNGVLSIMVTDTGMVQNKILRLPYRMQREELEQISSFLSERLSNLSIDNIDEDLLKKIERDLLSRFNLVEETLKIIEDELIKKLQKIQEEVYLGGTTYILDQPEFKDVEKVRMVLKLLEEEQVLHNLISSIDIEDIKNRGIKVTIGQENPVKEFHDLSIVTATYTLGERQLGKISVLGPTRMEYYKVMCAVRVVSRLLTEILSKK